MQTQDLWHKLGRLLGVSDNGIALASGEVTRVEIGRSGQFLDMRKRPVNLTAENMAEMAATFDATRDHKIKLGHGAITSETPDYGDVVGLEYDKEKDRLFASISPTGALVEQNRKGAFKKLSMELSIPEDDKFAFEHLGFLGAKRPAVSGLATVALAEGDPLFVCALADPDEPEGEPGPELATPVTNKTKTLATGTKVAAAAAGDDMDEKIQTENTALKERLAKLAAADVTTFLASDAMKKRVPIGVAENLRRVLVALAERDAAGDAGKLMLSTGDGKEAETPVYEAVKSILMSWTEKIGEKDTKEIATDGKEKKEVDRRQFAGADEESTDVHLAAEELIAEEKARGNVLSYLDALRRREAASASK